FQEHEPGLERQFQLEKGFLICVYKKDPTYFERSFWSHWARKFLLWTRLGNAVVSGLASFFVPKNQNIVAFMFFCFSLTTMGVVLAHLGLSLAVAQLHKPTLSWSCALLLLLSTIHIPPLQEIQESHTSLHYFSPSLHPTHTPTAGDTGESHLLFTIFLSLSLSFSLSPTSTSPHYGLALALVQFFYVMYLVLFGVPSLLAGLDGLHPPPPRSYRAVSPSCWDVEVRHFDVGLYIYIPLGSSRRGLMLKMLSTALAFGFVCLWHGGHDYLQYWALMDWVGVLVENGLEILLSSPLIYPSIASEFHNTLSVCPQATTLLPHIYTTKSISLWVYSPYIIMCVCMHMSVPMCECVSSQYQLFIKV
uniref:Hedgehog acyltransferase n=1 Tax=Salmo trutta TaxID=8032 RepID=A0A674BEQ7_SALTR